MGLGLISRLRPKTPQRRIGACCSWPASLPACQPTTLSTFSPAGTPAARQSAFAACPPQPSTLDSLDWRCLVPLQGSCFCDTTRYRDAQVLPLSFIAAAQHKRTSWGPRRSFLSLARRQRLHAYAVATSMPRHLPLRDITVVLLQHTWQQILPRPSSGRRAGLTYFAPFSRHLAASNCPVGVCKQLPAPCVLLIALPAHTHTHPSRASHVTLTPRNHAVSKGAWMAVVH